MYSIALRSENIRIKQKGLIDISKEKDFKKLDNMVDTCFDGERKIIQFIRDKRNNKLKLCLVPFEIETELEEV